jgi:hypothetical protein
MLREFTERDDPNRPEQPPWLRALLWFGVGFFVVLLVIAAFDGRW